MSNDAFNPHRHHAYGPPVARVEAPPIQAVPGPDVVRCPAPLCRAVWTHGHEHRCPHGGQPPPGVTPAAPPPPWQPPKPQHQGDTKFEQEALAEARREWSGMTDEQMKFARGLHTVVRHPEGGFHLETVPLLELVPTPAQTRAAAMAYNTAKKEAARAAKEKALPGRRPGSDLYTAEACPSRVTSGHHEYGDMGACDWCGARSEAEGKPKVANERGEKPGKE